MIAIKFSDLKAGDKFALASWQYNCPYMKIDRFYPLDGSSSAIDFIHESNDASFLGWHRLNSNDSIVFIEKL